MADDDSKLPPYRVMVGGPGLRLAGPNYTLVPYPDITSTTRPLPPELTPPSQIPTGGQTS